MELGHWTDTNRNGFTVARKAPAFQFYVDDFFAGTAHMSPTEVGIYMRLLCQQFAKGLLPTCLNKLARLALVSDEVFVSCWPTVGEKFVEADGGLVNVRLRQVVCEQEERSRIRAEAGSRGGSKRQANVKQTSSNTSSKTQAKGEGVGVGDGVGDGTGYGGGLGGGDVSEFGGVKSECGTPCRAGEDLCAANGKTLSKAEMQKAISAVIVHYQTYHVRSKPGDKERNKIRDRFQEGYSVDDLRHAIDGCHVTPHNCGENSTGAAYQSLELIMRTSDQVARFIENFHKPPKKPISDPRGSYALLEQRRRARENQQAAG